MSHRKTRTTMVVLAIAITVVLLVGIPVSFPGLTGTPVAVVIWAITAILLLPFVLLLLGLIVVDMFHGYILKWDDREKALGRSKLTKNIITHTGDGCASWQRSSTSVSTVTSHTNIRRAVCVSHNGQKIQLIMVVENVHPGSYSPVA